jgi:hypothetical protein
VGASTAHPVGRALHSEPVQLGVPATQLCAPVMALDRHAESVPHDPVQLVSFAAQLGQQLIA